MPLHSSKTILIVLAAVIGLLGFASVASYSKPLTPIADSGLTTISTDDQASPAVEPSADVPAADQTAPGDQATSGQSAAGVQPAAPAAPVPAPPPPRKKFAVVIGIDYDNNILGTIHYADQDAVSMYHLLTAGLGFPADNVKMLRNSEATRQNIISVLDWLAHNPQIDANSDVVFFYSGHGLKNGPGMLDLPGGQTAYALVPFDFASFDYRSGLGLIGDTELATYLGNINAGRMWINIDSCFSGGFARPGITGPNRIVTTSSRSNELSGEMPDAQRGTMMQYFVDNGVGKGLPIEVAFNAAAPFAYATSGQNPLIADDYPGNMNLWESP